MARENSLDVHAVSTAWRGRGNDASDSIIVRTTDAGRTWHTVLSCPNTDVTAFVPQGPDGAQAVARLLSAHGERFIVYRTRYAGKIWQGTALGT
jgi:photosystem II stability/assembly factor-like uncharacterized protein